MLMIADGMHGRGRTASTMIMAACTWLLCLHNVLGRLESRTFSRAARRPEMHAARGCVFHMDPNGSWTWVAEHEGAL
jgi:hypothetical protein